MRNSDGTFTKGVSGNPRGRPRQSITAALREIVDPREVAQFLADTMRNPAGKMPERMAAAFQIFDRFEGRSVSRTELQADITTRAEDPFDDLSDDELAALEAQEQAVLREIDLPGLLPPPELTEAEIVSEMEARTPVAAAAPAETCKTPGAAEVGIAQMAARARRGRGEP